MSSKARNNAGSVYSRTVNGRTVWCVEVSLGTAPNGKRRRSRYQRASRAEANKLLSEINAKKQMGMLTTVSSDTVRTLGLHWAREVMPAVIRPSTASDYEYRLRRYVFPYLGKIRMADLTPRHVQRWVLDLRKDGYGTSTVNGARRILFGMCKYAHRQGIIPANPVTAVDPVKRQHTEPTQVRHPWTAEECAIVLRHLPDSYLGCYLTLMLHTGMRPGEVLGLRWQDIDELAGRLAVTGTQKEERRILANGEGVVRAVRNLPKTKAGWRWVNLTPQAAHALHQQRLRQDEQRRAAGERWKESGYVHTTAVGTPLSLSNVRKQFMQYLQHIGVRYIRLHDIRHTVVVLALQNDVPIEAVSQAVGHSRTDITKVMYAPNVPRYTERFTNALAEALPAASLVPDSLAELAETWGLDVDGGDTSRSFRSQ